MAKFEYKPHEHSEDSPAQQPRSHCSVYGCPRKGQIYTTVWNCRYHAGKGGSSLAHVTLMLRNHAQEFNWYEHVLTATPVDFLIGDIAKKAPDDLRVLPNEDFRKYRDRVERHIDILLIPKSRLQEVAG